MRLYLQTQSSSGSVVLTGSYEEAQQNWLTPWLPGTDRFLAGTRRHTTTYLCETEYTGTGSSLKLSCPWWWCVFLAKWHSAIMHCAHHRLCWWAVIKNEEAQQNWLLTPWPWLHGTERFLAGMRRHTTYVKLNIIQVQAVLLTFRVHGDGVCSWQSDSAMMCTVYLQAITKRFKQVYRKTIKIVCGCGLESLYFRSGYRNRSVIGSKKISVQSCKMSPFHLGDNFIL